MQYLTLVKLDLSQVSFDHATSARGQGGKKTVNRAPLIIGATAIQ